MCLEAYLKWFYPGKIVLIFTSFIGYRCDYIYAENTNIFLSDTSLPVNSFLKFL